VLCESEHIRSRSAEIRLIPFFLAVLTLCISCEDPLPVYEEPKEVLRVDFFPDVPDVVLYIGPDVNIPDTFPYFIGPPFMYLNVRVTNLFDDVLQGPLYIAGEVDFTFVKDDRVRIVIPFTHIDASSSPAIDWNTRTLTLDPNQAVWLKPTWYWKQENKWIFRYTSFRTVPINSGTYLKVHEPMEFVGKVRLQVFSQRGPIFSKEERFSVKFQGRINLGP